MIWRTPGLFREAPQFRYLWLSRIISATGVGVGRIALILLAATSGPRLVSLVLLCTTLPQVFGPIAGAVADRVDQRRLLGGCEAGQGVIYGIIAITRLPTPVLLTLVTFGGLLAALMAPAGKSSVPRLVPAERLSQANALLGFGLTLQIVAGPAIGGALVALIGRPAAFGLNALSFFVSATLLARLNPLPPQHTVSVRSIAAEVLSGFAYAARSAVLRILIIGTFLFVSFAAMDNVALVFLVKRSLHGSGTEYGAAAAAFGLGMVAASLLLAFKPTLRPHHWLIGGIGLGAAGTAATGFAPNVALVSIAQMVAGAGNTADLVGTDTLVQQYVAVPLLGRAFGTVYTAAQIASAISYAAAGPLVDLAGPRATFLLAASGMLIAIGIIAPPLARQVKPALADSEQGP